MEEQATNAPDGEQPVEEPLKMSQPVMNDSWFGKPVEEVDPMIFDDTFCVISKKMGRNYIYRYSCSKSLFLFGPLNPLRRFAICVTTNRYFDILIMLTIACNCVTLAMMTNEFDPKTDERILPSFDDLVDLIEYGFLAIYTLEVILKVLAKGLIANRFSYLRNRWNLLDFVVVASGYVTIYSDLMIPKSKEKEDNDENLEFLRTFRVLRVVKTISIFPGLKMMINALLSSVVQLLEVMILTLVCLCIFALFGMKLLQGRFQQKCVIDKAGPMDKDALIHRPIADEPPMDRDRIWTDWVIQPENWKKRTFPQTEAEFCGNGSDMRQCGEGHTCIGFLGENPDDGWTSFDSFFEAMLSSFQLLTLDYWERLYDIVISTCGVWSLFFFFLVIFLGAYYLLNLMLAVVAMSYENEASLQEDGPLTAVEKLGINRRQSNFSFDELSKLNICKMTHYRKRTKSEREFLIRKIKMEGDDGSQHQAEGNQIRLDDAIFSLLGMKMTLGNEKQNGSFLEGQATESIMDLHNGDEAGMRAFDDADADVSKGNQEDDTVSQVELDTAERGVQNNTPSMLRYNRKLVFYCNKYLRPIVNHTIFETFITICIIANTVVLAMEHHGASKELEEMLIMFNTIFMGIFTFECVIKLMALQREYFQSGWNIFDMVIVCISYMDAAIAELGVGSKSRGLSVIRSMRLLRVFKLAQSWVTMKVLLNIIFSSFGALGNLTCVLLIILYIFAVMGMQVVGEEYTYGAFNALRNPTNFPHWHFKHFWYAFMMVFRVLCGEWIEPLWDCLKAQANGYQKYLEQNNDETSVTREYSGYAKCFAIFFPILIVGNFIVLNLFLALLLNSFDTEELNAQRERELEASGKAENLKNIVGLLMKKEDLAGADSDMLSRISSHHSIHSTSSKTSMRGKDKILKGKGVPSNHALRDTNSSRKLAEATITPKQRFKDLVNHVILRIRIAAAERAIARMENRRKKHHAIPMGNRLFLGNPSGKGGRDYHYDLTPETSDGSEELTIAGDCFPKKIWESRFCPCKRKQTGNRQKLYSGSHRWDRFRAVCVTIVGNPAFEWTILTLIFASSITLCFEDIHLDGKPEMKRILCILNYAFTAIFTLEMVLKWFAMGIWGYFTGLWTLLDAFIVAVSLISVYFDVTLDACSSESTTQRSGAAANLASLKALRTLRALRPLRAISRWEGMKIVVNALMYAIPSIFNVLLVCLLFWLIFSIMGVQFFKGQFFKCVDEEGENVDWRLAPTRDVCCAKSVTHGYSWTNTVSNYDNVFEGYLALLQVATFEGWMELMQYSVDAVGVDKQPITDYQIEYYGFYLVFIIFGSFFTLQLFIGVIIDNFNMLKKKYEGNMLEILLTPTQRNYYIAMKNLGRWKPKQVIQRPKTKFFGFFYDLAMSRKMEIMSFFIILVNMIVEGFEHSGQGQLTIHLKNGINAFFTTIYCLEASIKILGLGLFYFTIPWNVFDFILVGTSLIDAFSEGDLSVSFPIPPTMLRIVRVFRIGRILRLVKAMQGIRKLLFALVVSLPALFNIGALLYLITFIYAILGMTLFGKAPRKDSVDDVFNFETFMNSNLMLLRLMTAAGWNEVLDSLTVVDSVCGNYRHIECGLPGEPECLNRALVVAYIVSYLILTYLIVINLYIAIILENYVEASNEEDVGIVEDDLEMFYVRWSRYDPFATQFIAFDDLPDFLDSLDPPMQLPKPNIVAIVAFNLPIARGNKMHCLDILQALITHVLGQVDDSPEFRKLQSQMEHKFQKQFPTRILLDIVSSTRRWKIEQNAAIIIQRTWRAYWKRTHGDKHDDAVSKKISKTSKTSKKDDSSKQPPPTPPPPPAKAPASAPPAVNVTSEPEPSTHGGLGHMMGRMGNTNVYIKPLDKPVNSGKS